MHGFKSRVFLFSEKGGTYSPLAVGVPGRTDGLPDHVVVDRCGVRLVGVRAGLLGWEIHLVGAARPTGLGA